MLIGPLQPNAAYQFAPDVMKPLQMRQQSGRSSITAAVTKPHALTACVLSFTVSLATMQPSADQARAMNTMLLELAQNTEYQRAGIFIRCRDDGTKDAQDGWYIIDANNLQEIAVWEGWANPQLQVIQRSRRREDVRSRVLSAYVPDQIIGSGGVVLAAYPMGMDLTQEFPPTTFSLTGRNGTIGVVENPGVDLRAPVSDFEVLMTQGRCYVYDETSTKALSSAVSSNAVTRCSLPTAWEVFHFDHRVQNGYLTITNDLLRYTLHIGDNAPLIEVWSGGAWVTVGSYQLQAYSGSVYTVLPLRGASLLKTSSEEVWWEEIRYDTAGTGAVRVINRIRRGSRLIESQIISFSGLGLVGAQSVGLVAQAGAWAAANAADTSGVVWTQAAHNEVPGFAFITKPAFAASTSTPNLYSGLSVPAGTVAQIGIVAGLQDAIYTAVGTAALYAAKQASYNRMAVKQFFLP